MALLAPRKPIRPARFPVCLGLLLGEIAYCAISIQTLPFAASTWYGELPVLAVWQGPKARLANWLLDHAVQPVIVLLGLSRSASPDRLLGRPYGMLLAYLIPVGLVTLLAVCRTRLEPPHGTLLAILWLIAVFDFCLTMALAHRPALTFY